MPFEPVSVFSGAVLGAAFTTVNRWWQYRRENWYVRVTDFCKMCSEAADVASTYWLDSIQENENEAIAQTRLAKAECALIGYQAQLDGLFGSFSYRLSFHDQASLSVLLRDFSDTLTGGDFQVRDRQSDFIRARLAHVTSSELAIATRLSLDKAIKLTGLINYIIQYPPTRLSVRTDRD